ncbi:hypothetical protein AEAC466_04300 [Asticcacaulis sp. AC466]|uniref:hypothetical protein n=1 Tax=Asticcacaulis sp. AC466 TaxID=1282362 RepID=UPI0003C3CA08|nr:hypothetical protein [Asticcacaulis sp. AC466]ESQ85393.1 hypothetical protein AEAC466_04300 [Asticcacaulis sp. AC466]
MTISAPANPALILDDGTTTFAPTGGGTFTRKGTVGGAAHVFDTGSSTNPWSGIAAFQASVLKRSAGNEQYIVTVEGCANAGFVGEVRALTTSWNMTNPGQQDLMRISNLDPLDNTIWRYLRLSVQVSGTLPQIALTAFVRALSDLPVSSYVQLIQLQVFTLENIQNAVGCWLPWATGVEGGGPNGDGKYPIYDGAGHSVLVACPAQWAADGGGLSQGNIDGLPVYNSPVASPMVPATVPLPGGGRGLAKFDLFQLTSAWRQSLVFQSDLSGIQAIFGLTTAGLERQIDLNAIVQVFGGVIDPRKAPYNCKFDFRDYRAFTATAGSSIIESADANVVTAADLGKEFWLSNVGPNGCLYGWIGQIIDSRHFRIYTDNTFSTPKTSPNSQAYLDGMWGTDDTVGIQRAFDDAEPFDHYSRGKVVVMTGIAIVSAVRFGSIAIYGFASQTCGFAQRPENSSTTSPMVADKITGVYASKRPAHYSLINLSFFGQKYCQFYTSFRRCFEIRGGNFGAFYEGAPYGHIENLIFIEAQWEGASLQNAFAGKAYGLQAFSNNWCGIRCGLWDLNGHSWHCEANGHAGILSHMAGANLTNVKCSYNGGSASGTFIHENSANYTELGVGNSVTNIRVQESWGHGICLSNTDPLSITNNASSKNKFYLGAWDDVGNMGPGHGVRPSSLPSVRAMIYVKGSTTNDNILDFVTGTYGISVSGAPPENNATHGYFDTGGPQRNIIHLRTPGTTNNPADWYAGRTTPLPAIPAGTGAYAPGPWGTDSATSISARNEVTVNGVSPP